MSEPENITKHLDKATEDLICDLGRDSGLGLLFNEAGQRRLAMPIPVGRYSPPGPFPESFYRAQKWLRRHRTALQKAILEDLNYGANFQRYGRGHEVELVQDLSRAITPICRTEPYPVDPVLVAVVLLRLGIEEFCGGYESEDKSLWSLELTLGIDRESANRAATKGQELVWKGKWKEAIPYYQEALAKYALHMNAMNDMAYIYATYLPAQRIGLEYAERVYFNALKGDPAEPYILDTMGWASYRFNKDLARAEELLRAGLSLMSKDTVGYISIVYHLICVLKERGKESETKKYWQMINDIQPTNAIDAPSYQNAKKLMGL